MTLRQPARLASCVVLAGLMVAVAATPALAQTSGAGGSLTSFLQNVVNLMNSGAIRLLAVIAVIMTAAVWLLGHLDLRRMAAVILGIVVMFSAAGIVDLITGGSGA
jgi:type IV secretory pathway VirB2 component (pilin)